MGLSQWGRVLRARIGPAAGSGGGPACGFICALLRQHSLAPASCRASGEGLARELVRHRPGLEGLSGGSGEQKALRWDQVSQAAVGG